DDVVVGARDPDRTAGVAAESGGGEVGGRGDGRSAAAAAGRASQVVGVERLSAERADRRQAQREFVKVHFAKNHRARVAELPHLKRVLFRYDARQGQASARRRHVAGVEVVL